MAASGEGSIKRIPSKRDEVRDLLMCNKLINTLINQCCPHIETRQLICCAYIFDIFDSKLIWIYLLRCLKRCSTMKNKFFNSMINLFLKNWESNNILKINALHLTRSNILLSSKDSQFFGHFWVLFGLFCSLRR